MTKAPVTAQTARNVPDKVARTPRKKFFIVAFVTVEANLLSAEPRPLRSPVVLLAEHFFRSV